jgi:opacity protein-like surface antigen
MASRFVLALILIILSGATVAAQSGVEVGPQIGYYKAQDADNARGMVGVATRLRFSDLFGIEASLNYREEMYSNGLVDVRSWPFMVTGLLYPIPVVYGAVGTGWYSSSIDYNFTPVTVSETKQEFGWHFGGGVELPLDSITKLVGDIRYVFLNYNFKSFPGSNGVNSDFYVLSAELLFSF